MKCRLQNQIARTFNISTEYYKLSTEIKMTPRLEKKKGSGRRRGINSKQSWSTEKKIWNTDLKGYHRMGKNQFWLNSLCFPVGLCVREHKKGHGLLHDYMTVNIIYWGSKKEIRKYKTFSQCIIVRTILQKVKGTQFFV